MSGAARLAALAADAALSADPGTLRCGPSGTHCGGVSRTGIRRVTAIVKRTVLQPEPAVSV